MIDGRRCKLSAVTKLNVLIGHIGIFVKSELELLNNSANVNQLENHETLVMRAL